MSENTAKGNKLKTVFVRTANKELQPERFGNCLVSLINEGIASRLEVAKLLGADVSHIRKAGNSLNGSKLAYVAQAAVGFYERHHG